LLTIGCQQGVLTGGKEAPMATISRVSFKGPSPLSSYINMPSIMDDPRRVVSKTATALTIIDAEGRRAVIEGEEFSFDGYRFETGTIESVTITYRGELKAKLADVSIDAEAFATPGVDKLTLSAAMLAGSDWITGTGEVETLRGFGGHDSLRGYAGADFLVGDGGRDDLDGGAGNDRLYGGAGRDVLRGGEGNDRLDGGGGADGLDGGGGADTFAYRATGDSGRGAASDRITGFEAGRDRFDLRAIDVDTETRGDQAFELRGRFTGEPGQVIVRLDAPDAHGRCDGRILADTDGDRFADLEITLIDATGAISANDFLL
jgi:Ca2+-binding RTX toxin-like protein